jgi:hypothetical protein
VALASLPLGIIPANAARVSEGTSESISVVEAASSAAQFNLKSQDSSTGLVASRGRNDGGGRKFVVPVFLQQLLAEFFGIKWYCSPNPGCQHKTSYQPIYSEPAKPLPPQGLFIASPCSSLPK